MQGRNSRGFKFLGSKTNDGTSDPVGMLVNYPWRPYDLGYGRETTVAPGETIHYVAHLSGVLDLKMRGSYTIQIQ